VIGRKKICASERGRLVALAGAAGESHEILNDKKGTNPKAAEKLKGKGATGKEGKLGRRKEHF